MVFMEICVFWCHEPPHFNPQSTPYTCAVTMLHNQLAEEAKRNSEGTAIRINFREAYFEGLFSWTTVVLAHGCFAAKKQGLALKHCSGSIWTEPTHSGVILNYRLPRCSDNSYPKENIQKACRRAAETGIFGA